MGQEGPKQAEQGTEFRRALGGKPGGNRRGSRRAPGQETANRLGRSKQKKKKNPLYRSLAHFTTKIILPPLGEQWVSHTWYADLSLMYANPNL